MRLSALPVAIALAAFSASVPASALDRRDIQGIWRHPDTGSLIQIYSCGGGICAKVVSTADRNLKDVKNPSPALRDRLVAGVVLWERPKNPAIFNGSARPIIRPMAVCITVPCV